MGKDIISMTVEYKGWPVKIENGKIFLRSFGTTYYDHSMHWDWMEIKEEDLHKELKTYLKERELI